MALWTWDFELFLQNTGKHVRRGITACEIHSPSPRVVFIPVFNFTHVHPDWLSLSFLRRGALALRWCRLHREELLRRLCPPSVSVSIDNLAAVLDFAQSINYSGVYLVLSNFALGSHQRPPPNAMLKAR